ncbi:hypothetical protein C8R43DRAFT_1242007 [Mycena crocata]|nr:hypothetical protein C8R43DRAFT_1242007 [Mycena crocata]
MQPRLCTRCPGDSSLRPPPLASCPAWILPPVNTARRPSLFYSQRAPASLPILMVHTSRHPPTAVEAAHALAHANPRRAPSVRLRAPGLRKTRSVEGEGDRKRKRGTYADNHHRVAHYARIAAHAPPYRFLIPRTQQPGAQEPRHSLDTDVLSNTHPRSRSRLPIPNTGQTGAQAGLQEEESGHGSPGWHTTREPSAVDAP